MMTTAQSKVSFPREAAFTDAEYRRRLGLTRKAMDQAGVEVLLLFDPSNICYLAGHHSVNLWDYMCLVVPLDSEPFLIVWQFEMGRFNASAWVSKAVAYQTHDDPITFTARVLREHDFVDRKLAVEQRSRYLSPSLYNRLRSALGGISTIDGSGIVESVRLVKSEEEIEVLRKSASITSASVTAALKTIGEGVRDSDIAAEAARSLISLGSEFSSIEPIVAVGQRSGLAHSSYNGTPVRDGDSVFIELGACVRRYTAPLMRTGVVGKITPELQLLAEYSSDALAALIDAARPGARACDVAQKGLEAITPVESRITFHYVFGYSVGIGFPPSWLEESNFFLRTDNLQILVPGMVFHLPLTLRVLARCGVGFSETILITDKGCEVLTNVERKLVSH